MSNLKISELPAAGELAGDELMPVVQNGETRKLSLSGLAELLSDSGEDVKISELPPANELSGDELLAVVQDNETRKVSLSGLAELLGGSGEDVKISELPPANELSGDELLAVVQDDETRKVSVSELLAEAGGGRVPAANIAFADADGDDATGEVGNAALPFKTAQAAYDVVKSLASNTNKYLLKLGVGNWSLTLSADWNQHVSVSGTARLSTLTVNASGSGVNGLNGSGGYNVTLTSDKTAIISVISNGVSGLSGSDEVWNQENYPNANYPQDDPNWQAETGGGNGGNTGNVSLTACLLGTIQMLAGNAGNGGMVYSSYGGNGDGGNGGSTGTLLLSDCEQVNGVVMVRSGGGGASYLSGTMSNNDHLGTTGALGAITVSRSRVLTLSVSSSPNNNNNANYVYSNGGGNLTVTNSEINFAGTLECNGDNLSITASDSTLTGSIYYGYGAYYYPQVNGALTASRCRIAFFLGTTYNTTLTLSDCLLYGGAGASAEQAGSYWGNINATLTRCTGAGINFANYNTPMNVTIRDCTLGNLYKHYDWYGGEVSDSVIRQFNDGTGYFGSLVTFKNNRLPVAMRLMFINTDWGNTYIGVDGNSVTAPGAPGDSNMWNL